MLFYLIFDAVKVEQGLYYSRVKRHQLGMIWLIDIQLAPGNIISELTSKTKH